MLNFTKHEDPGHGWLQVTRTQLERFADPAAISHYSYQHGNRVYLEEDCDMGVFLDGLKRAGVSFTITNVHTENTPIRHYECYEARPLNRPCYVLKQSLR